MRRRDFLLDAAIASAIVAASPLGPAIVSEKAGDCGCGISAVLYDERHADCQMFADSFMRRGALKLATNGDAGGLWYGRLRQHLMRFPGSVAGMTTDSDWGVSRGCGREAGFTVAYEGSHDFRMTGAIAHSLRGCGAEKDVYTEIWSEPNAWADSIANALSRHRTMEPTASGVRSPLITTLRTGDRLGYLTSWLLRPSQLA